MGQRLAIIGGDAAGMSAAANARRRDRDLEVVAFERGGYTSFSACGIPYHVAGLVDESDDLIARSPDQHRANGIDVRIRHEVLAVDLDRRELTVLDRNARRECTEPFDQLVVATGAHATAPPIPGVEATEPARTIDAVRAPARPDPARRRRRGRHRRRLHRPRDGRGARAPQPARHARRPRAAADEDPRRGHGRARPGRRRGPGHPRRPLRAGRGGAARRRRPPPRRAHVRRGDRGRARRHGDRGPARDGGGRGGGPRDRRVRRAARRRPPALSRPRRRVGGGRLRRVLAPAARAPGQPAARHAREQAGPHRGRQRDRRRPGVSRRAGHRDLAHLPPRDRAHGAERARGRSGRHRRGRRRP